jgi:hypothetical protein
MAKTVSLDAVFVAMWGWMALGHRRDPRRAEVARLYQERGIHRVLTEDQHVLQGGLAFSPAPS